MDPISFQKILNNLYGPFSPHQGESKARLVAAEKRLGIRLPKVLRDYYLLAGKDKRLNESHNRLLPLDDLLLEEDALVFFVENQAEVVWAILSRDLDMTDPPVYRAENSGDALDWQLDHRFHSDFLITMACWQAAAGGMEASGIAAIDPSTVEGIRAHWQVLSIGENAWGLDLYTGIGQVLILLNDPHEGLTLLAAARTREDFTRIESTLKLSWQERTHLSDEEQS